jgi:hypothetical protein
MPKETTMKGQMADLQRLTAMLSANSADLPQLEGSRERLEAFWAEIQEAAGRQAIHTAAKQEATQQLNVALVEGMRLANVLRLAVKQHYGIRSEKLAEFGLQPFRGRPRKSGAAPEPSAPSTSIN